MLPAARLSRHFRGQLLHCHSHLVLLGIAEVKLFIIYGYMIHGLTTGLLLFILLHMTSNDIFIKARSAENERIKIENQNQIEQDKNQSLSGFMHMLGHEAKNAMSVMQMSTSMERITDQQRTRANNAIIGLTSIIDRCNQAIRLDNKEMTLTLEKCDLAGLLSKLCASVDAVERITLLVQGPAVVELLSNLVFEGSRSCGDLVCGCGFNSVFEPDACDDFGQVIKAA